MAKTRVDLGNVKGPKGDDGATITAITKNTEQSTGLVDHYDIELSDGQKYEDAFTVTNGTGSVSAVNPEHLLLSEGTLDLSSMVTQKLSELEDDVDEITEELSRLSWKKIGDITGVTAINFPSEFEELSLKIVFNGNYVMLNIPFIALDSERRAFWFGGYRTSSSYIGGYVQVSSSSCILGSARENGIDYNSTTTITAYYR